MVEVSDYGEFSEYVHAFDEELKNSNSPESAIKDKVSACAILVLSNREDPYYAVQHPELKKKAIAVLKEAPLIVEGVNLSALAEEGDISSLLEKESLIQKLPADQKLQLLRAARLQSIEVFRKLAELVSVIDAFSEILLGRSAPITMLEHEDLFAKLSPGDKEKLLNEVRYKDQSFFNAIAAAVTVEDIEQSEGLADVLRQKPQGLARHLRAYLANKDTNLIYNIKKYGFDRNNPEDKAILASLRSKLPITKEKLGRCIQDLDLSPQNAEDKKVLIDLAKQIAKNDPNGIGEVIQNFGLDPILDRETLLEIINLASAKGSLEIIRTIKNFGFDLKKEPELFQSLVKQTISMHGRQAMTLIEELNLTDQEKINVLAKGYMDAGRDSDLFDFFSDLKLKDNEEAIWTILQMAAEKCPNLVAINIKKIGRNLNNPDRKNDLIKLAQTCAKAAGWDTLRNLENFSFHPKDDKDELIQIISMCVKQNPKAVANDIKSTKMEFLKQFADEKTLWLKALLESEGFSKEAELTALYPNDPLITPLLKYVKSIDNSLVKGQILDLIGYLVLKREQFSSREQQELATWSGTFLEILKLQEPSLREPIIDILLTKRPDMPADSLKEALAETLVKTKGISSQEARELTKMFNFNQKSWKDSKFEKTFLSVIIPMIQNEGLTKAQTTLALTKAFAFKEPQEIRGQLMVLKAILDLDAISSLNENNSLDETLLKVVYTKLPFLEMSEKDAEKLQKTFLSSRYPLAFFIYAANVSKLGTQSIRKALALVFKSVLAGNFKEVRETLDNNLHLQQIHKEHPEIVKEWFKNTTKVVQLVESVAREEPLYTTIRKMVRTALENKHLSQEDYPFLFRYFKGESLDTVKKELVEANKIKKDDKNQLQLKILTLFDDKFEKLQEPAIQNSLKEIERLTPPSAEFRNDLKNLSRLFEAPSKLAKTVYLSNTDDPIEIQLAGTEIPTCQRIDGTPSFNQGLLGYLLNGHNRLLELKTAEGGGEIPITTRSIARLMRDKETHKPVMLLERIYPENAPIEYKEALKNFAKEEAVRLGVPLVSVEEGDRTKPYKGSLENLGGTMPEYVDSTGGIEIGDYITKQTFYV